MKTLKVDGSLDRQIITAMIVSTRYLMEVSAMYSPEFLSSSYSRVVADWCLSFFKERKAAPGRHIQDLYDKAIREKTIRSADDIDLIHAYLLSISEDYDVAGDAGINVPFLIDETLRWFKRRDLEHLAADILEELKTAGPEQAEELIKKRKCIERATMSGFSLLRDKVRVHTFFDSRPVPLIEFDGALGEIVNPWMTRDQCIGLFAPPKGSKTLKLTEFCVRGCMGRCNVAYFQVGDLSEDQTKGRVFSSLTGLCSDDRYLGIHLVPVLDCLHNQIGDCADRRRPWSGILRDGVETPFPTIFPTGYKPCIACKGMSCFTPCAAFLPFDCKRSMTAADTDKISDRLVQHMGNRDWMCDVYPNSTVNVEDLHNILNIWKDRLGFIPDIIIIDYADVLAWEPDCHDERTAQNARWKRLRRLSQDWHSLVVVASQADAESFGKETLSFDNFSEDCRKYAHATGILAIHQTEEEKRLALSRVSWILGREGQPDRHTQAVVLQNPWIGRAHVDSFRRTKSYNVRPQIAGDETEESE